MWAACDTWRSFSMTGTPPIELAPYCRLLTTTPMKLITAGLNKNYVILGREKNSCKLTKCSFTTN
jgi:hypothetical protein